MMKRLLFLAGVALAVSVVLPASAKSTQVTDTSGALSVTVPAGWRADKSGLLGSKLFLLGPQYGGFTVNINLMTESVRGTSLPDYLAVSERNAPKMMSGYAPISKGWTTMGGIRAGKMVFRGDVGTPPKHLQFMSVTAIRNRTAYTLTYTAPPSYYTKHLRSFEAVVKSLAWKDGKSRRRNIG